MRAMEPFLRKSLLKAYWRESHVSNCTVENIGGEATYAGARSLSVGVTHRELSLSRNRGEVVMVGWTGKLAREIR